MGIRTAPVFDAEMDGGTPDRIYQLPSSIPPMMAGVVNTGVVDGLAVTPTSPNTMSSRVGNGRAYVDGAFVEVFGTGETVTHQPAEPQSRVDLVVMRLDRAARTLAPAVRKGTAGSSVAPVPLATSTVVEIPLANVTVGANVSFLSGQPADRRGWATVRTGTPSGPNDAVPLGHLDQAGVVAATPHTLARRNSGGRLIAAHPTDRAELTPKSYVDNHRQHHRTFQWQTAVVSTISNPTGPETRFDAGAFSMPSGWTACDVVGHAYFELRFRGALHWRYVSWLEAWPQGGTWGRITPTSHADSLTHETNTSTQWVYGGQTFAFRMLMMESDMPVRFVYQFSNSLGLNPNNLAVACSRRYWVVDYLRRA